MPEVGCNNLSPAIVGEWLSAGIIIVVVQIVSSGDDTMIIYAKRFV